SGSYNGVASITQIALQDGLRFEEGCLLVFKEEKVEYHTNWGIGDTILKEVVSDPTSVENLLKVSEPQIVPDLNDFLREINFGEIEALEKTMVVVPIIVDGETTGFLALYDKLENRFIEEDINLLEIFGGHVGSAIQGIRHEEALHERQENEIRMILEGAGRVSSMVRHDLRGPLQTVKNAAFILKKRPDEITKMGPIINRSIDYMVKIMEDLQYQDRPGTYSKARLNLNMLIKQTLVYQIIPDHITLKTDLCETPVEHFMDKIKIQRMLDNLIRNAIEAMEKGGTLTISTRKCEYGTELKISDTGLGIKDMNKLFTPFHTTKINGMGLGLISVKQTLDAHSCMLEVESELGKGTTFTIKFPEDPNYMGNSATRLSSITVT
ncbi:GAF domain-containing protein, partial [Candidatus Bathyarchaeota archaeon]|nr:GAF domain-containing protein [Candidatus Bathyarchaeota archaeon]